MPSAVAVILSPSMTTEGGSKGNLNEIRPPSSTPLSPLILESPYAGYVEENVAYARAALRDSLLRGKSPIASHLLYTQPGILKDSVPDELQLGMEAGLN